jgi:hypothetical protein
LLIATIRGRRRAPFAVLFDTAPLPTTAGAAPLEGEPGDPAPQVGFLLTCRIRLYKVRMSYYRTGFTSFEEFKREALLSDREELGKDELELLYELDDSDNLVRPTRRPARSRRRE